MLSLLKLIPTDVIDEIKKIYSEAFKKVNEIDERLEKIEKMLEELKNDRK